MQIRTVNDHASADQFSVDHVVVGHSARMRAIFDFVKVVSRSDSSVIITGESGTGKEVIANLLHHQSRRRHQPFVAVSCALFSENLIETELFGHERGAFTGAIKDKPGRFETGAGRHAVPRRHRRRAAVDAGEAAARASRTGRSSGSAARGRSTSTCASSPVARRI